MSYTVKRFLTLLAIFLVYSCAKNKHVEEKFNLSKYNSLITIAENEILEGNFDNALLNYEEAEKNIKFMLSIDLNNALICSTKIKNWKKSIFWCKKLLRKGIKRTYFYKVIFNELRSSLEWDSFQSEISKCELTFLENNNQTLIENLNNLNLLDQEEYCLIPSGKTSLPKAFDKTKEIDVLLDNLIVKNGYPTEELIGVNMVNDTLISPLPKYFGLIRHSKQANSNLINKHLQMAVKNGHLKREVLENTDDINLFNFIKINCKIYEYITLEENLIELKNKRGKILYNNHNKDKGFILYAPIAELMGAKFDDFKNSYKFLDNYSGCKEI